MFCPVCPAEMVETWHSQVVDRVHTKWLCIECGAKVERQWDADEPRPGNFQVTARGLCGVFRREGE